MKRAKYFRSEQLAFDLDGAAGALATEIAVVSTDIPASQTQGENGSGERGEQPGYIPRPANALEPKARENEKEESAFRRLPLVFRHDDFDFEQLCRCETAAIYKQLKAGRVHAYEVVRIRRRPAFKLHGREIVAAEAYPTSEKWGRDAWTLIGEEKARQRFAELVEGVR